jgi:hypothetical protein
MGAVFWAAKLGMSKFRVMFFCETENSKIDLG